MNKYDKDKFNEIIKKEVKSISIDIPEELENNHIVVLKSKVNEFIALIKSIFL